MENNIVEMTAKKNENDKAIHIERTEVPYSEMRRYIEFVASVSLDTHGNYHAYLRDYAETLAVLTMYTDYRIDNSEQFTDEGGEAFDKSFDEILAIRHSKNWAMLTEQFGKNYQIFSYYVDAEIEMKKAPLANIGDSINAITNLVKSISGIIDNIDIEKLQNTDFSQLAELANAIDKHVE